MTLTINPESYARRYPLPVFLAICQSSPYGAENVKLV